MLFTACKNKEFNPLDKEIIELNWTNKKGYILRNEGFDILEKLELKNITATEKRLVSNKDTIGRYLRSSDNKHYIFCIWDPQERKDSSAHFLIELKPFDKNKFEVIAKERYVHGNTVDCWDNLYNGLDMHYDYFTFQTCRGNAGYSGVNHYYFTYVRPQNDLKSIPDKYAISNKNKAELLASKKKYHRRAITYNYRYESFDWKNAKEAKERKLDSFTVYYELDGTIWTPNTTEFNYKFK